MAKCLIIQPIHQDGLMRLRSAGIEPVTCPDIRPASVNTLIGDCDAVITRDAGLSAEAMRCAPGLEVISVHGAGYDPVDLEQAAASGILVCTTPGTNAQSVAELTLCLALALARRIPMADNAVRAGKKGFRESHSFTELHGKTAFIVGWGAIGQRVGAILKHGLGMKLVVLSRKSRDIAIADRVSNIEDGLAQADLVTLHVPQNDETRSMISDQALSCMKPGAFLINTARAGLIDEPALASALRQNKLAGAALDASSPDAARIFAGFEQVLLTPHLGGTTEDALRRTAVAAADNVISALAGEPPKSSVDLSRYTPTTEVSS